MLLGNDIYVMDIDGTNPVRLTLNNVSSRVPAWSPDGSRIAFTSNRDGNDEIFMMNADGSGQTQLHVHVRPLQPEPVTVTRQCAPLVLLQP